LTHGEFLQDWALSKLTLGVNLIALCALEGLRVAGYPGLLVSLGAFLIPSAAITAAMTAGYDLVHRDRVIQAALAGIGPVAAGMTFGMAYVLAVQAFRRGTGGLVDRAYAAIIFAIGLLTSTSPVWLIVAGVVVGSLFLRGEPLRTTGEPRT
jgi:chromate transport protein ChrA